MNGQGAALVDACCGLSVWVSVGGSFCVVGQDFEVASSSVVAGGLEPRLLCRVEWRLRELGLLSFRRSLLDLRERRDLLCLFLEVERDLRSCRLFLSPCDR